MMTVSEIMDKVDPQLLRLIGDTEQYSVYKEISRNPSSATGQVVARGNLGIEISNTRPLGIVIQNRG